jgi:hypothetical protein
LELFYLIHQQFPKVNIGEIKVESWNKMVDGKGKVTLVPTWNSKTYFHDSVIILDFNYNFTKWIQRNRFQQVSANLKIVSRG